MSGWDNSGGTNWGDPSGPSQDTWTQGGGSNANWDDKGAAHSSGGGNQWNGDDAAGHTNGGGGFTDSGGEHRGGEHHGGDQHNGAENDGRCYNCGDDGHQKTECPHPPRAGGGQCRGCGQEGHMVKECPVAGPITCYRCRKTGHGISECPEPPVCPRCRAGHDLKECPEPMICRVCNEEGHLGKNCPNAPPRLCGNCQEEGHEAFDCKNPRKIDMGHIASVSTEEALKAIRQAVKEKDIDDIKAGVKMFIKAAPETTYLQLEQIFRAEDIGVYLIGIEKQHMLSTFTNMDFQGNLDKKFAVNYRLSKMPLRPRERELWPADDDENQERLADAGETVTRGVPKCTNCNELGHISKSCPEEKQENLDKPVVKCVNCDQEGHRMRDCPEEKVDKFACKNCKKSGHTAKECPEPRSAEGVECNKCNEMGHFSRDCPQGGGGGACHNCGQEGHKSKECTEPRKLICRNCDGEGHLSRECPEPLNAAKVQCRNCDEYGHFSKECPKPRDMGKVKCQNCGEMGHYKSRCTNAHVAEDGAFGSGPGGASGDARNTNGDGGGDGWGPSAPAADSSW